MTAHHYTVWQCKDFCCQEKPHAEKWWNVSRAPGDYVSVRSWREALTFIRTGWAWLQ